MSDEESEDTTRRRAAATSIRTRRRLNPAGRRPQAEERELAGEPIATGAAAVGAETGVHGPLMEAAGELFSIALYFGQLPKYEHIEALRQRAQAEVESFEQRAQAAGLPHERIADASYLLCTFLDEAITHTPWGDVSAWHDNPLLMWRSGDFMGGDRCFEMLDAALASDDRDRDFLELFYVCLALGFKGRYYDPVEGERRLAALREELYEILAGMVDSESPDLSRHWRTDAPPPRGLARVLPLWVVGAVALALVAGTYVGFAQALHRHTDPVFDQLSQVALVDVERDTYSVHFQEPATIQPAPVIEPAAVPARPPVEPEWLVLFSTNQARLSAQQMTTLDALSDALKRYPQLTVEIFGRTDKTGPPAVNARLSRQRAAWVRDYLIGRGLDAARVLRAEGLAFSKPLSQRAPNDFDATNRSTQILVHDG